MKNEIVTKEPVMAEPVKAVAKEKPSTVVITTLCYAKAEPKTSARGGAILRAGEKLEVLGEVGEFYKVKAGFVPKQYTK